MYVRFASHIAGWWESTSESQTQAFPHYPVHLLPKVSDTASTVDAQSMAHLLGGTEKKYIIGTNKKC